MVTPATSCPAGSPAAAALPASENALYVACAPIDHYALGVLTHAHSFSSNLLRLLQETTVSDSGMELTRAAHTER